jgi:hypothetical protein
VGARDGNLYRHRFIPTFQRFVASHDTVWSIPDEESINVLQQVWDTVYKNKIPHVVEYNDAVFQTVAHPLLTKKSDLTPYVLLGNPTNLRMAREFWVPCNSIH